MKRPIVIVICLVCLIGAVAGCQLLPDQPEAVSTPLTESFPSPPATLAATALAEVTVVPPTDAPERATEPPPPTLPPATSEAAATESVPETATATPTPATVLEETVTPVETATGAPATGGDLFAPGQQDTRELSADGQQVYPFRGQRFTPSILFVDPENTLDVALTAYSGNLTGETDLSGLTPLAEADNAPAGRPETLVLSPDADGDYSFVVAAATGEGSYTAYLYDLTSPAAGMAVQQQDSLEAGGSRSYEVTSQGARPVLAMVDPVDQTDVVLEIFAADGELLTSANFSGAGGVEVAYVLPLGTTTYRVVVRESTGAATTFDVAVVTLE